VTGGTVVIGLGNSYRRDDGVGIAAAVALDDLALPNVLVRMAIVEPMSLLEVWAGAELAVLIDAAIVTPSTPGRVRRCELSDVPIQSAGFGSHNVDIARTHALGRALRRVPDTVVVFTIEAEDTGHGTGLTPQVARAVPEVVGMVAAEINRTGPARRSPRPACQ
jgi:hydrogenase maturation protease